jgi:hypothetical protein
MSDREPHRDTLRYALAHLGSKHELAARLNVSNTMLDNWLCGIDAVPDYVFMAAVDLIVASSIETRARSRELLARF